MHHLKDLVFSHISTCVISYVTTVITASFNDKGRMDTDPAGGKELQHFIASLWRQWTLGFGFSVCKAVAVIAEVTVKHSSQEYNTAPECTSNVHNTLTHESTVLYARWFSPEFALLENNYPVQITVPLTLTQIFTGPAPPTLWSPAKSISLTLGFNQAFSFPPMEWSG